MNFLKHPGVRFLFLLLFCSFLPLLNAQAGPYLGNPNQPPHLPGQAAPSVLQHPNGAGHAPAAHRGQAPKQAPAQAPSASGMPDKNHPYLGDPSQPPRLPGGFDPSMAGQPIQVPSVLRDENLVLTPYLSVLTDPTSSMNIDEVTQPENDQKFTRFRPETFTAGAGACWLRFYLQPVPEGTRPETFLLDMGESLPGEPVLYSPAPGENGKTEWKESRPGQKGVMVLPAAGTAMTACYIRLDGMPGTWFAPVIRTPHDAATDWGSLYKMAAMVAMAIILAICLLRGLVEQGYWRTFSVLYLICALGQAVLGVPSATGPLSVRGICAVIAPGVAMFFLPLIGRSLMRTRENAPVLDLQYLFLSLLGLIYAAVSLIPSLRWLSRFTEIWPLAMFALVPTTVAACLRGLPGSFRFLLGCVIPPAAVLAGILGMKAGYPPHLLASLPLWGIALGALLVTAFSQPVRRQSGRGLVLDAGPAQEPVQAPSAPDGGLSLGEPESPATLPEPAAKEGLDLEMGPESAPSAGAANGNADKGGNPGTEEPAVSEFNLQEIMQRTSQKVAGQAEERGTGLSWFMAPDLGLWYRGCGEELGAVLSDLLSEGTEQLSKGGSLRCSVKKIPGSRSAGGLLFSLDVQGLDEKKPNSFRSLGRAARLAALSGGYLSLECRGSETMLNFTLNLTEVKDHGEKPSAPEAEDAARPAEPEQKAGPAYRAILLADNPNVSAEILGILREAGCGVKQAADSSELMKLFDDRNPADLIIFQGRSASAASSLLLTGIREFCRQKKLRLPVLLAYTPDQTSWPDMARTGFTHALTLPVDREALLGTLSDIGKDRPESVVDLTPDLQVNDVPDLFGSAPASRNGGAAQGSSLDIDLGPETQEPAAKKAPAGGTLPINIAFDNALLRARAGLASGRMADVAAAASDIARAADEARMEALFRIASLVDRAARAGDASAVHELLPELSGAVERKIRELNIQR